MKVFNITNILKPISSINPYTGEVTLISAYFKPKWFKPSSRALFNYDKKGIRNHVTFVNGNTYTFGEIKKLLKLNLGEAFKSLDLSENKVVLQIDNNTDVDRVSFCPELVSTYNFPTLNNYATGKPIQSKEVIIDTNLSITLNNAELVVLRCSELDTNVNLENSRNCDALAILPLKASSIVDGVSFITHNELFPIWKPLNKHKTHYDLTFKLTDLENNPLPIHSGAFIVLNKE